MTIEHCDNWDIYGGNGAHLTDGVYAQFANGGWLGSGFTADPDGVSPGYVFSIPAVITGGLGIQVALRYILAGTQPIVGIAQRVWINAIPYSTDGVPILAYWADASNNIFAWVGINPQAGLIFSVNGTEYQTEGPVITANGWYHIEAKLNETAGTVEIRVEGASVLLETGLTIGSVTAQVGLGLQNPINRYASQTWHKDLVIWNGAGTQNNDFLGAVIVVSLTPVADVSLNWTPTPNTDTGATILATSPPQDGVVYLDAPNPPPAAYKGIFENLSGDISSVKCLMTFVRAAKVDGGDGNLQVGLISSPAAAPATALGANRPITATQTYWRDVFELDPKTAAAWLPSSVNLAELQINRTT